MTTYCQRGATKPCRNLATQGEHCDFHAKITRAAMRCMRGECRPSCTRGGCWRKLQPTRGICPACNESGPDEEGCPRCPGFWFTQATQEVTS